MKGQYLCSVAPFVNYRASRCLGVNIVENGVVSVSCNITQMLC